MKKALFLSIMVVVASLAVSREAPKVDPNHLQTGGYGYLIHEGQACSVWWAEGAYKVMRDAPTPTARDGEVKIWSAKNEYESFILVVKPTSRMEGFRVSTSTLEDDQGNVIDNANITIRKVEYVRVRKPTDSYAFAGWWPDPLPLYEQPETLFPAENQAFWVTVKVPADAKAGDYSGNLHLSSDDWSLTVPVRLHVWDFTLPHTPSIRSGFGFNLSEVRNYDNLRTPEEEKEAFDYYMQAFRDYKISPYNPFQLNPIREEITGVAWQGGYFDNQIKQEGNYAYRIEDNSFTYNAEGSSVELIPVNSDDPYTLCWSSCSRDEGQNYLVGVECYNAEKRLITFENRFENFTTGREWKRDELNLSTLDHEVKFLKIRLFPTLRTASGEKTGTVWFDDVRLVNNRSGENEFPAGNFEVNLNDIDLKMDFTDFNRAGKRYFDDFGFTGYRLSLRGLGGGTFHSRSAGVFAGFNQGSDEYNLLMERYLAQIQDNLERGGWLGKEYIYWFDEPGISDYPFVKETNELIKRYAPKLTTFLTEHIDGPDLSDVTDISCTIWHKLNHERIKQMNERGLECWSYLCTGPKSPWITLFIDHDAINMRMWLWGSYKHKLKGILVWATNYWNSGAASPPGYLQNPWEEAMSYTTGYDTPLGVQRNWGNGDGRFFYPLNRDPNNDGKTYIGYPVPSLRLELLRDGIEDYEYLTMLEQLVNSRKGVKNKVLEEARQLLDIPEQIYTNEQTYSKNPRDILEYRQKVAESILKLK
jgi:hypothetical protein